MYSPFTDKMLTFKQYEVLYPYYPYKIFLQSGEKKLFFFGTSHTHDVNDPILDEIVESFHEISPKMTLVEGALTLNTKKEQENIKSLGKDALVKEGGEVFFTAQYALAHGSDILCPEPEFQDEVQDALAAGHKMNDCFLFYLSRDIHHLLRTNEVASDEKLNKEIHFFNSRMSTDYKLHDLQQIHQERLDREISLDIEFYEEIINPANFEAKFANGSLNEISRHINRFRDIKIFSETKDALEKYNSVFVVYGGTHAVMIEPALRELFWSYFA